MMNSTMSNRTSPIAALLLAVASLAACAPVETKTMLTTPVSSQIRRAGPGDTVMSFESRRPLPNIVGRADLFGRTTDAGRTTVRYIGTYGQQAVFERKDIMVSSNATTMSESPLIIPQTSNTYVSGNIGGTPVYANARTTGYQVIGPRGSSSYATAEAPIQIALGKGQSVIIQGRTLRVVGITPTSVDYVIE